MPRPTRLMPFAGRPDPNSMPGVLYRHIKSTMDEDGVFSIAPLVARGMSIKASQNKMQILRTRYGMIIQKVNGKHLYRTFDVGPVVDHDEIIDKAVVGALEEACELLSNKSYYTASPFIVQATRAAGYDIVPARPKSRKPVEPDK